MQGASRCFCVFVETNVCPNVQKSKCPNEAVSVYVLWCSWQTGRCVDLHRLIPGTVDHLRPTTNKKQVRLETRRCWERDGISLKGQHVFYFVIWFLWLMDLSYFFAIPFAANNSLFSCSSNIVYIYLHVQKILFPYWLTGVLNIPDTHLESQVSIWNVNVFWCSTI